MSKYIKIDLTELTENIEEGYLSPGNLLDIILEYFYAKPDAIVVFGPSGPGEEGWAKIRDKDFLKVLTKVCKSVEEIDPEEKIYSFSDCIGSSDEEKEKLLIKEAEKTGKYPLIVELDASFGDAIAFISKERERVNPEELEYNLKWVF